jgi:predicted transcriptional regulator
MSTLTLNLPQREADVLEELAAEQAMSKTAVMRQALRLYQMVHVRAKEGEQLAFTKEGKLVPVVVIGLPAFD